MKEYDGKGYGDFKGDLAEAMVGWLKPFQEKVNVYLENEDELKRVLDVGAEKAIEKAEETMKRVRKTIGITL